MLNLNSPYPVRFVHRRLVQLTGNAFEISVVGGDEQWAAERIDNAIAEISRVLQLLSVTDKNSQINQVNQKAGISPVKVSQEVFNLVNRSLKISDLTRGAFDITDNAGGLTGQARQMDYRNVILDAKNTTIFLTEQGMCINLGSIIKGYATDRAKYVLQIQGVLSGVVNAFGDLITWGSQPNNKPWTIEAADPDQKLKAFSNLNISNMAVSTSGNNNNNSLTDRNSYVDTLNPKTGLPFHSIKSVSVLSPSAELAAAMSAPVKVMGVKMSLSMFNRLNQLVCVIVNKRKKVYTSKSISLMMC
ncbi:thiamine biosynthesis lipoprotein [Mucilaginibacter gracilis]|uniref:FAD:protein FMN transferase n=1 Tax=Mucilaginibacter gracilis TaxID=423350 RepID=A0A495J910_9SPHI|nr:FAD:protein FMN transferase [Mucilaginibacter gracilis]RKR85500.1 thiamine biosynthesis lipoprotein [Mucilaginibacter gracilis]